MSTPAFTSNDEVIEALNFWFKGYYSDDFLIARLKWLKLQTQSTEVDDGTEEHA